MILSHRWFSAAVIATLALGIGINTTVFTLVNAVLFKPLDLPNGERLITVSGQDLTRPDNSRGVSYPEYLELKQHAKSFEALEAVQSSRVVISEAGNPPERYVGMQVSPGLFSMLQVPPILGRGFNPNDGKPGAPVVALLSHGVWKNRYGADPAVINRAVRINGSPATIIGVMPENFKFPQRQEVWLPLVPTADFENRDNRWFQLFGLLQPGTRIAEAGAEAAVIAQRLTKEFPDTNKDAGLLVRTFHDTFNGGPIRIVFLTMLGAVAFVLMIACANVANLMLSRALAREREIAVRASLGASRVQIIRQLLVECVLLSCLGGLCGLGLAQLGVHWFDLATQDVGKPYWIIFKMDYVVFGYFALVSIFSGILFGLVPALRASRVDLNTALKDGAAAANSGGGRMTAALVVVQFALTVVLLAGAGLMIRSFFRAQEINAFVPQHRIFTARVALPDGKEERYHGRAAKLSFYDDLLPRLAALPGVTHAAYGSNPPGTGSDDRAIEIEGQAVAADVTPPRASIVNASPGYFALINLPMIHGRAFTDADGEPGKESAVVTRAFAAKHWPGGNAIGARFRILSGRERKPGPWLTVVGMSADVVQRQDADAPALVYVPYRQEATGGTFILLRTEGDPAALTTPVRTLLQERDTDLPLFEVRTLAASLERERWFLVVFGSLFFTFAAMALLMAAVGLYAVVAQATARRTREIGIRMALGATTSAIMQLVLRRGFVQLGLGLVLGVVGALFATQLMKQMLIQVDPRDPLVFCLVTVILLTIGLLACWFPARRAAGLHPVKALRQD